jgi:hypothetical protein
MQMRLSDVVTVDTQKAVTSLPPPRDEFHSGLRERANEELCANKPNVAHLVDRASTNRQR